MLKEHFSSLQLVWSTWHYSYFCFLVSDQICPSLPGRQVEVHRVPTDSPFVPGQRGEAIKLWEHNNVKETVQLSTSGIGHDILI